MDYKLLTLKEIEYLWGIQMIHMCMGTQDNQIINNLSKEVRRRGEMNLLYKFQKNVIEHSR